MRILPRTNEDVNEEWLGDKSRFALDGLKRRRLDKPWVRQDGKLRAATWPEAFKAIADKVKGTAPDRIGAVAGDLCDVESMLALKDLMGLLGSANLDCRQDGAALDASRREFYLFNSGIAGIEEADAILLIGSNPRRESPVLNARIRKRWLAGGCKIASVGALPGAIYDFVHIGRRATGACRPRRLQASADGCQAADDHRWPVCVGPDRWGGGAGGGLVAGRVGRGDRA